MGKGKFLLRPWEILIRAAKDFGPSYRENPVTASFVIGWLVIGILLWYEMVRTDINLIINVLYFSAIIYSFIKVAVRTIRAKLVTAEAEKLEAQDRMARIYRFTPKRLADIVALAAFAVAVTTALFYGSLISGSWVTGGGIPSACLGTLHIHHWMWSLPMAVRIAFIFTCKDQDAYRRQSRLDFALAGVFLALFVLFVALAGGLPGDTGVWRVLLALMTSSLSFGFALRSNETHSRWFTVFVIIGFGIVLGIFIDGVRGAWLDYPESFIYVSSETCGLRK